MRDLLRYSLLLLSDLVIPNVTKPELVKVLSNGG